MAEKTTTLLAIESSCDETGVSVVQRDTNGITVLSEIIASQAIHETTGGVVPEVAAREHLQVIGPMIANAMQQGNVNKDSVHGIAVTVGPGLMPALAVGVQAARTLAYAWDVPIVPVHHIEGHIYSALLNSPQPSLKLRLAGTPPNLPLKRGGVAGSPPYQGGAGGGEIAEFSFPSIALIVSGGHTMLIEIENHLTYKIFGQTRDDAAGEVFDKVARMLQLSYPGGPKVSELARQGNSEAFAFPRPMMASGDLDFSFSGLKTSVLYKLQEIGDGIDEQVRADIAASFEAAVIDCLAGKLVSAMKKKKYHSVLLAGGVAANGVLRARIQTEADNNSTELFVAPQALCGDNATMIGQAGLFAYEAGRIKNWKDIGAIARVSIESFSK